jgi:predicted regulator of Ras-like GTPase activity (Roadblock/LC7/MglB family)
VASSWKRRASKLQAREPYAILADARGANETEKQIPGDPTERIPIRVPNFRIVLSDSDKALILAAIAEAGGSARIGVRS